MILGRLARGKVGQREDCVPYMIAAGRRRKAQRSTGQAGDTRAISPWESRPAPGHLARYR